MWGETALGFDGGEVLHLCAEVAAKVLDEPVEQRRERQRIPRGPHIVVGGRIGRGAVPADPAVGRAGQGDEHRRAEGLAVWGGVGLADRARADLPPGQVRGVLTAARRSVAALRAAGVGLAAQPTAGEFGVQLAEQLVQLGRTLPGLGGPVTFSLGLGSLLDPHGLDLVGRGGVARRSSRSICK